MEDSLELEHSQDLEHLKAVDRPSALNLGTTVFKMSMENVSSWQISESKRVLIHAMFIETTQICTGISFKIDQLSCNRRF